MEIVASPVSTRELHTLAHDLYEAKAAYASRAMLVGIAGPPGSGKTTLSSELAAELERLGCRVRTVPMDGFHFPNARLEELGLASVKGAPETFDVDGFVTTLARIRWGVAVCVPGFDHGVGEPQAGALVVDPGVDIVIVEGNYLLYGAGGWETIEGLLDHVFFLEVPWETCRARLLERRLYYGASCDEALVWVDGSDRRNYLTVMENSVPDTRREGL